MPGSCVRQGWLLPRLPHLSRIALVVRHSSSSNPPAGSGLHGQIKHGWKHRIAQLDALFLTGVSRFHEITGYAEIEKMKAQLSELEKRVSQTRERVREAREQYNEHLAKRTNSQSEMNELLMRKQSWLPSDLERFTQLYKDDHRIQLGVVEAKKNYDTVESQLEELQQQAGKLIGARYQEEQLWSDKIRQASTWGTWVLMGINILLFIIVQLILEPWKRRRLVHSFEAKVQDIIHESRPREAQNLEAKLPETPETDPASMTEGQAPQLTWNTLINRVISHDNALQPVMQLRPIEAGALALASGALVSILASAILAVVRA